MSRSETDADWAVTRREPLRGGHWGREALAMTGLERARANLKGRIPQSPVARLSGMKLSEVGPGIFTAMMPASPWWQSGSGVFPAGVLAFLSDAPLGGSVTTTLPAGAVMATSAMSIDFVRPATIRCGSLIGRGRLVHSSGALGLSQASIEDARGRVLANATSRCVTVQLDPANVPEGIAFDDDGSPDPYAKEYEGEVRDQEFFNTTDGFQIVRELVDRGRAISPVWGFLGMRVVDADRGSCTLGMWASPWLTTSGGTIYGGALSLLADLAVSTAVMSTLPAATAFAPLDMKINFIRPVRPFEGELIARADLVHQGRSMVLAQCTVSNQEGKPIAVASESVLVIPGRSWDRPVNVAQEVRPET